MRRLTRFTIHTLGLCLLLVLLLTLIIWPVSYSKRFALTYAVIQHFPQGQTGNGPPNNVVMWHPGIEFNRGIMTVVLQDNYGYFFFPFDWPESLEEQVRTTTNQSTGWHLHSTSTNNRDQSLIYKYEYIPDTFWYIEIRLWLLGLILLPISIVWLISLWRKIFTKNLRMQTNLCLHCGYNLTGVESEACPECGAARPLVTVSSAG